MLLGQISLSALIFIFIATTSAEDEDGDNNVRISFDENSTTVECKEHWCFKMTLIQIEEEKYFPERCDFEGETKWKLAGLNLRKGSVSIRCVSETTRSSEILRLFYDGADFFSFHQQTSAENLETGSPTTDNDVKEISKGQSFGLSNMTESEYLTSPQLLPIENFTMKSLFVNNSGQLWTETAMDNFGITANSVGTFYSVNHFLNESFRYNSNGNNSKVMISDGSNCTNTSSKNVSTESILLIILTGIILLVAVICSSWYCRGRFRTKNKTIGKETVYEGKINAIKDGALHNDSAIVEVNDAPHFVEETENRIHGVELTVMDETSSDVQEKERLSYVGQNEQFHVTPGGRIASLARRV